MAAKAKIISMSDAREARRRRLSADDRVSNPVRAVAVGETPEVPVTEAVEEAVTVTVAPSAPTPRVRPKASVSAGNRVSAEEIAAKRAKAEAKQAAKAERRAKVLSVLPGRRSARPNERTSVAAADRVDLRAETEAGTRARARAEESARRRKEARAAAINRRVDRVNAFRARFDEKMQHPKFATAVVFISLLLVVGGFLYPTARTYYQVVREHDRLQAELTAVIQRNAKMAAKINALQTDEGIIREAREQLGWVQRGENAVIVYGTGKEPEPDVDADIVSADVKAPVTWYSPVLDIIFGYR